MSDRKRAIETLKQLRLDYEEFYEEHNNEVTHAYDMAIASLEADEAYQLEYERTTKNDLGVDAVSRQAINRYIDYILNHGMGKKKSFDFIKRFVTNLPSVTPQEPRWIPVSEKLPDIHNYSDYYLVTLESGGIYIAMFTECDGKHWWKYDDVVAWMPLPKPYEPQESEDNK